jgi:membrane protein required for colicin V production
MSLFDIILLVIIGIFALAGLWFGLIHTLGSLAGTVVGVFLATRYYEPAANWLVNTTGWGANFSKVLIFIIVFFIINRLVGLAFWIVDKILSIFTKLPFVSGINRFLGLIFGVLEGMIVLGMVFYFIARFPLGDKFMSALSTSQIAPATVKLASVLWPLIPDALKMLQSTIDSLK